ncbi:4-hydroxy-tetrahydrodipicolinate reductase [Clostridium scatologenes]|uniref:4-hydroxy-tetrahydrodipicolinate reductase n=1 Tax=Clostridium scatologenes TaxID=1548 RepID=A0A0E3MBU5_CLOSL|nr:4-hydroxy-tetrahydrodipicolinate reductase [Clostridium scatologenes]AKA71865.1 Dihydrodipicolinate reductase [Clostridium scatologenes]
MVKIILSGCNGKMGKVISKLVDSSSELTIVAGIDKNTEKINFPVFSDISKCTVDADVILDFSRPDALEGLLKYSKEKNIGIVLCTTGYTKEQIDEINKASKEIPVFRSANMSIGINVINKVLRNISELLYKDFDIEIIEKHHNQKVDAPSGTAILLGNTIKDSIPEETKFVYGREGISKRTHDEIGIHAVRGGSIVGDHEIIFAGKDEIIELKHTAMSRDIFAIGALKACQFMFGKVKGLYSMDDVLK